MRNRVLRTAGRVVVAAALPLLMQVPASAGEVPADCQAWLGTGFPLPQGAQFTACTKTPQFYLVRATAPNVADIDAEVARLKAALASAGFQVHDTSRPKAKLRSLVYGGPGKARGQMEINPYQGKELRISISQYTTTQ